MIKEEKPVFSKIFLIVGFIFLVNIGVLFYKTRGISGGVTGMSIKDVIPQAYNGFSTFSKVFLIVQWAFLILILLFAFAKDKKVKNRKEKEEVKDVDINKIKTKRGTDLDALYTLLQNKKQLNISTIAKIFKVNKKVSMEWCKTLELGNLVDIYYPQRGEPRVKIKIKKIKI